MKLSEKLFRVSFVQMKAIANDPRLIITCSNNEEYNKHNYYFRCILLSEIILFFIFMSE